MQATFKIKTSFQLRNPNWPLAAFNGLPDGVEGKCALRFKMGFLNWCGTRDFSIVCMGWKPMSRTLARCALLSAFAAKICTLITSV